MKTLTPELRSDIDPKEIARRLVSICGGKKEAMSTIVAGAGNLHAFASILYTVSQEVSCVRETSNDAYNCIHKGRTRKGGSPNVRRYL